MDALAVVLVHWHLAKMMARSVKACLRDLFCCLIVYNLFNLMKILLNLFDLNGFVCCWWCSFACCSLLINVKVDFRECVTGSLIDMSIARFLMLFP